MGGFFNANPENNMGKCGGGYGTIPGGNSSAGFHLFKAEVVLQSPGENRPHPLPHLHGAQQPDPPQCPINKEWLNKIITHKNGRLYHQ